MLWFALLEAFFMKSSTESDDLRRTEIGEEVDSRTCE